MKVLPLAKRISTGSLVVASQDQASCDLGDETVVLQLSQGDYYGLDSVGSRVWELLQKPIPVSDLCQALLDEFEVSREQCERDLLGFLDELAQHDMINVTDEIAS